MLIVSALTLSCREEHPLEFIAEDSPERPMIEYYLGGRHSVNEDDLLKLSALKNAIDYSKIRRHSLSDNEDVLIADIGAFGFEDASTLKALFFVQQGEVIRSNLVSFTNTEADHNKLILSILKRRFDPGSYHGRITFYNIYRDVLFFNNIDNGRLTASGIAQARSSNKANSSGRTQGCIDWFLVTTYHYAGGGSSTSEVYLGTTCGQCQSTRMHGRANCGGGGYDAGGYGSYGPALPPYPSDGDKYSFTDPDGKTTTYIYDAGSNAWTVYMIILPEYTVQSYPLSYPYLVSDGPPLHNETIVGPDGLMYIFNGWSGAWEAGYHFLVGGPSVVIRDRNDYFNCFKTTSPAILTIYADQPKAGSNDPVYGTDVGHSWMSITQTVGNTTVTRVFGYYPLDGASPMDPTDPGTLVNDSAHEYDVSLSVPLNARQLSLMLNYTINQLPGTYDLNTYNCTDFVVEACRAAGIPLPENSQTWFGGGGLCPGQLGEDLRTLDIPAKPETRDLDGGTGPANSGGC
jgi:hypothetical protein